MTTPQPPWGPSGPDPRQWRPPPPPPDGQAWDQLFELDDTRRPVPRQRDNGRDPKLVLGVIALVVVIIGAAVIGWLATRGDAGSETSSTTTSSVDPEKARAQERLSNLLPAGYPPGSCGPTEPADGGAAVMSCGQNTDAGGPSSATFTLSTGKAALDAALRDVINGSTTVECPGRIQSPGPWRRNATPQQVSGTLFCGYQGSTPVVAWTDDEKLLFGEVRGRTTGPSLVDLYAWWSSHS